MTGKVTFLLGGARSGKSRRALELAQKPPLTFLATAEPLDDEMRARIKVHKEERLDGGWGLIEEPLELVSVIRAHAQGTLLVDCLTLWLNNLVYHERDVVWETARFVEALRHPSADMVFVSNEVGLSIAPENALARRFRDLQGRLNQSVAAVAHRVELVVAGLPLVVKDGP